MSCVNVTNVQVLENPAKFTSPLQFEIAFECLSQLKEDLEWKIIYVGSADTTQYDQELDSVLVGPVPVGLNKFIFQANPPDPAKIPQGDLLGVTVILLQCAYKGNEFVRIGFYVSNEYDDPTADPAATTEKPAVVDHNKITRNILTSKPRVTKFQIDWDPVEA